MTRTWAVGLLLIGGVLAASEASMSWAAGSVFPARPIRLIVPFVAGGTTDLLARLVAPRFGELLGQQLVIDNRGGAGGIIGSQIVAKSPPDGYTLGLFDTAFAINATLFEKLPYDPERDFTYLAIVATSATLLVAHAGLKVRTVQELIAAAKKNPGKISSASSGVGSLPHLATEMLKSAAKIDLLHVPFKGNGAAVTDVIAGHTDLLFTQPSIVMQHIQAGTLVALAITGDKPSPLLPNVPTFASAGLPAVSPDSFRFLAAPRGLPGPIDKKLTSAAGALMAAPDVQARLDANGFGRKLISGAEAQAFVAKEIHKWRQAVKDSGAKAN